VSIESISRPVTPNTTAAEKRTSPAADNNSIDPFEEIGGQEGSVDDMAVDDTDHNGNQQWRKRREVKLRVAASVKTRVVKVVWQIRVMMVKWERRVMTVAWLGDPTDAIRRLGAFSLSDMCY
jgi:hypothetical protein